MNADLLKRLEAIAREHTLVPQLTARMSDSLDFHDVSCVGLQRALEEAYKMGRRDQVAESTGQLMNKLHG